MRVKSAVDWWVGLLIWFTIVISISTLFLVPESERGVTFLIVAPVVALMLWIYFGTYYELKVDHLYCRSGPLVARIPYCAIKSARLTSNPISSMALSLRRIEITYVSKSIFGGLVYISPPDREGFLRELKQRCSRL